MKTAICLVLILILGLVSAGVCSAQARVVVREQVTIMVDRAVVRTDVPPINVSGQVLVPVRSIFDAFHAEVDWFPAKSRVYIRQDTKTIWLRIGESHAKINDDIVPLSVPAMLYRGRTMVPLRFIAEALGSTVDWNPDAQTITIFTEPQPAPG